MPGTIQDYMFTVKYSQHIVCMVNRVLKTVGFIKARLIFRLEVD